MAAWLLRRCAAAIGIVVAVVTLTFALIHLAPGTPFQRGEDRFLDPVEDSLLRHAYALDRPLPEQYVAYLGRLARGDFGTSFALRVPVADLLAATVPNTLLLSGTALAIDLLLVFALLLHWFPAGGASGVVHTSLPLLGRIGDRAWHLALPALTLGLVGAGGTARYQRAALLEVAGQDFIRTARAKGLGERRIWMAHTFRNGLLPMITLLGLALPFLLTGSVLVETVFSWPGMGRLAADAIFSRDYPVVTATTLIAATMVVLGSLAADVLYVLADPRIRTVDAGGAR